MNPYYSDGGCTIYHGDAREVLPALERADLVLTDPPYGIGKWNSSGGQSLRPEEAEAVNAWDVEVDAELLALAVDAGRYAIVWGGNYVCDRLGAWRSPLIWDKAIRGMHFADGELAWTNFDFGTLRIFNLPASANDARGQRVHPTQKPVDLMRWCILQLNLRVLGLKDDTVPTVLDPFMGSGSTLRAAKDLGYPATGIEIDERYCEAAARRLGQEVLFGEVG